MPKPSLVTAETPAAYLGALQRLLLPLARLLIAKGVTHPMLDELLQRSYVAAAERWFVKDGERITASRLQMLTGIHRKKIAPLQESGTRDAQPARPSLLQSVLDEWTSNPSFMDSRGRRKRLALSRREGGDLSFEALVENVSKDIRPRAVLDRLIGAGFAEMDTKGRVNADFKLDSARVSPGGDEVTFERILRPATEAVAATVLRTGDRSASYAVEILGVSEDTARELTLQVRQELADVLLRFNERAERRAREERRRHGDGPCAIYVGSFEWIDGQTPRAPTPTEPAA